MRSENLSHEVYGVIIKLWNKDARAISVHVRHASVKMQVHCVNVVIGVVLGELHVVRVVPVVVCDDAVVRRTLVLIAFTVAMVFIVAILRRILLYWKYSVYRIWRTTTQANAILEVSTTAPIIEIFLQLVAMEWFLVEFIIIQRKSINEDACKAM